MEMFDIVKMMRENPDVITYGTDEDPLFESRTTIKALGFEKSWGEMFLELDEGDYIRVDRADGSTAFYITETGLYGLAMVGTSPIAQEFRNWMYAQPFFKMGSRQTLENMGINFVPVELE